MKVCIISDTHDNRTLLKAAVDDALEKGAEAILHCGDVVAPSTLNCLRDINIPLHVIHGNNTGDLVALTRASHREGSHITYHGQDAGIELDGKKIFIVHYPHYARAMALTGDWDIVCCGHDHKAAVENIKNINNETTVYANPGTTGGVAAEPTYIMACLETMNFSIEAVPE